MITLIFLWTEIIRIFQDFEKCDFLQHWEKKDG